MGALYRRVDFLEPSNRLAQRLRLQCGDPNDLDGLLIENWQSQYGEDFDVSDLPRLEMQLTRSVEVLKQAGDFFDVLVDLVSSSHEFWILWLSENVCIAHVEDLATFGYNASHFTLRCCRWDGRYFEFEVTPRRWRIPALFYKFSSARLHERPITILGTYIIKGISTRLRNRVYQLLL